MKTRFIRVPAIIRPFRPVVVALVGASLALTLLISCDDEQVTDGLPEPSETATIETPGAPTDTPTPYIIGLPTDSTPVLDPTVSAHATEYARNFSMTMEGPAEVRPGETLTYRLTYEVRNAPDRTAIIPWSDDTVRYVSSRLAQGTGHVLQEPGAPGGLLQWTLYQGGGVVEITLQVPQDHRGGEFRIGAYEPGTQTTSSNTVTTRIVP